MGDRQAIRWIDNTEVNMEIGDLANWFTGIATFCAVLTTLHLSFFEKRQAVNNDIVRTKESIKRLSENAIKSIDKELAKGGIVTEEQIQKTTSYIAFRSWLTVSWSMGKSHTSSYLLIGQDIFDLLSGYTEQKECVRAKYFDLIKQLDDEKKMRQL
jgi:hypothetical protein